MIARARRNRYLVAGIKLVAILVLREGTLMSKIRKMSAALPLLCAAALIAAAPAHAITVDGVLDAAYGAPKSVVSYDPVAPESNFATPTPFSDNSAYSIYLAEQGGTVYGFLSASVLVNTLSFANLYFDVDPANGNGSDLGFEITNDRAFIPGVAGYSGPLGIAFAVSADGKNIEFALPDSLFTGTIPGLSYGSNDLPGPGDEIVLRLSQSFGYSVAGGATYGDDRLGRVALAAAETPLPAALPLFASGLGALGFVGWRKRRKRIA
jgi:hypothetical protein